MKIVSTPNAYMSKSPLSQALTHDGWLFCSGQVPVNPSCGTVPEDIREQAHQVLTNIGAVLTEAGSSFTQVVRTNVYLVDIADASAVNEIYAQYFPGPLPTRTMVCVNALANHLWRVEIDVVAYI